ncbi:MAG: CBS domain-containing protein [Fervidicoccaceae archaeon]
MEKIMKLLAIDIAEKDFPVVDKDDTLSHAFKLMEKFAIDRVLVTDDKMLVGIMTKRDVLGKLMVERTRLSTASSLHISSFMNQPIISALPTVTLKEAAFLMTSKGIGSLPLVDGEGIKSLLHKIDFAKPFLDTDYPKVGDLMVQISKVARVGERVLKLREEFLRGSMILVPVVDSKDKILGMITVNELADAMLAYHEKVVESRRKRVRKEIFAEEIMYRPPLIVEPDEPISVAAKLMIENRKPGVIVAEKGEVKGILTAESLLRYISSGTS